MASLLLFLKALVRREQDCEAASPPEVFKVNGKQSVNKQNPQREVIIMDSCYCGKEEETWSVAECFTWS